MGKEWIIKDNITLCQNFSTMVNGVGRGASVAKLEREIKAEMRKGNLSKVEASEIVKRRYRKKYLKYYNKIGG